MINAWIDPGRSTGLVWGYRINGIWKRQGFAQVEDSLLGLLIWINANRDVVDSHDWGCEKYVILNMPGMSHTLDSTYPLVVEGALITLGVVPDYDLDKTHWQRANSQYFMVPPGVKMKPSQKKSAKEKWLRDHGLLVTGTQVGCGDANDVNSAQAHMMNWLRVNDAISAKEYFDE